MKEVTGEVRTIHPKVVALIGMPYALELLAIARDLRSGAIKPEKFSMFTAYWWGGTKLSCFDNRIYEIYDKGCGTPCCIIGHLRARVRDRHALTQVWNESTPLMNLFSDAHPDNPQLAADAIERYVYENHKRPWLKN